MKFRVTLDLEFHAHCTEDQARHLIQSNIDFMVENDGKPTTPEDVLQSHKVKVDKLPLKEYSDYERGLRRGLEIAREHEVNDNVCYEVDWETAQDALNREVYAEVAGSIEDDG